MQELTNLYRVQFHRAAERIWLVTSQFVIQNVQNLAGSLILIEQKYLVSKIVQLTSPIKRVSPRVL